jgi:hypothetical protein
MAPNGMAAGETVMTFKGVNVDLKIRAHKLRAVIVARGDAVPPQLEMEKAFSR